MIEYWFQDKNRWTWWQTDQTPNLGDRWSRTIPNHHNRYRFFSCFSDYNASNWHFYPSILQLTTGVLWGFYWCMMLLTNHLSTVSFFYLIMNDTLLTNLFISPDIRNWIRNIEQHASDNVNKILVGNKADMDESKRVC